MNPEFLNVFKKFLTKNSGVFPINDYFYLIYLTMHPRFYKIFLQILNFQKIFIRFFLSLPRIVAFFQKNRGFFKIFLRPRLGIFIQYFNNILTQNYQLLKHLFKGHGLRFFNFFFEVLVINKQIPTLLAEYSLRRYSF